MRPKWSIDGRAHQAALLLSQRATWEFTAEHVGVTTNTIGNWMRHQEMRELVQHYEQRVIDQLAEDLDAGVKEMVDLWRQMVRGEVKADDRRLDRIGPIVSSYFIDSFVFAEKPTTKDARSQMAVQFNIGSLPEQT